MLRIGLIQMRCSPNPPENLDKAIELIRQAAAQGTKIVCLQELFRTVYFCQVEDHKYFQFAEEIPGPTTDRLGKLAAELDLVIIASLFERRAAGLYHNTAVVIDADGKLLGKYRKMHIPDDPLFYEKFYFAPGDLGFHSWDTKYGKLGVLVCWDQWYPEAARLTDRVASFRKGTIWRGPTCFLGDRSKRTRNCQRMLCCGAESSGARGTGRRSWT